MPAGENFFIFTSITKKICHLPFLKNRHSPFLRFSKIAIPPLEMGGAPTVKTAAAKGAYMAHHIALRTGSPVEKVIPG